MANITLKAIKITNFKGVKKFATTFNQVTNIYGANAAGKTTVFDAFLWLFFGKNSESVSVFEVKRLDSDNKFIKDLVAEVSAVILVDGVEIEVRKELRQKWPKRRGDIEPVYQGDENVYFWNDVPCKESEFKTKVAAIVDERLFRLITDPFFFNSLKWQDRRNTLIGMAGEITADEVLRSLNVNPMQPGAYSSLIAALNQQKTTDEYRKEISVKKKRIKDELELIPARIQEVQRSLPEERDYSALRTLLNTSTSELEKVQAAMNGEVEKLALENQKRLQAQRAYNEQVQARQAKRFDLEGKIRTIEFEARQEAGKASGKKKSEIDSLEREYTDKKTDIDLYYKKVQQLRQQIAVKNEELEGLRRDYVSVDAEVLPVFDEEQFCCPSCGQLLPAGDIEEKKQAMTENFNAFKSKRLQAIQADAAAFKNDIAALQTRVENGDKYLYDSEAALSEIALKIEKLKAQQAIEMTEDEVYAALLEANGTYELLKAELKANNDRVIEEPKTNAVETDRELSLRRSELNSAIASLNQQLAQEDVFNKQKNRLEELSNQEAKLSQELVEYEGIEYSIQQFEKARMNAVEAKINGLFKFVTFKLFTSQVNGGEAECCETLIKGVPFSDANNAARINAGVDIINALCAYYKVHAPIFVDNRESVTDLLPSGSQIVNLIVSSSDKTLRVA